MSNASLISELEKKVEFMTWKCTRVLYELSSIVLYGLDEDHVQMTGSSKEWKSQASHQGEGIV